MSSSFRISMLAFCGLAGIGLATLLAALLAPTADRCASPATTAAGSENAPTVDLTCDEPAPAGAVHKAIIFGGNDPRAAWPAGPTPDPVSDASSTALEGFAAGTSVGSPTPASSRLEPVPDKLFDQEELLDGNAGSNLAAAPRSNSATPAPTLAQREPAAPRLTQPRISTAPRLDNPTAADTGALSRAETRLAPSPPTDQGWSNRSEVSRLPVTVAPRPAFTQQADGKSGPAGGFDFSKLSEMVDQLTGSSEAPGVDLEKHRALIERVKEGGVAALQDPEITEQLQSAADEMMQALAPSDGELEDPLAAPDEGRPRPEGKQSFPAPKSGAIAKPKAATKTEEDLQIVDEGDGKLYVHIQQESLRKVLELLSEQGGMNILASPSVEGTVSASLNGVDIEEALNAILRSTGFISRRDGQFIYVGTPEDFQSQDRAIDRVNTRVYRPNYTTAADLKQLIEPLLSESVGKCTVTAPAQIGIATNNSNAGGDSYSAGDAVVVQDYEANLAQIDQLVDEVDQRPSQVAIEAMILSVNLNDENQFGINWEMLRNQPNVRFGIGSPRQAPLEGTGKADGQTGAIIGQYNYAGGLSYAFLDSSLGSFLNALETIGDTDVIATPRLMCLNKQRAEILIGAQLGYISTTVTETSTAQSVQFLEVGAQLRLRPFIASDGLIRMEVHPELSTGQVRVAGGFTLPDKEVTQVTTNVIVRDGCTVIIGGLMREDLSTSSSQLPLVGNLPVLGGLFRQKTEKRQKREILVLITPHVICDAEAHLDGEKGAEEFHRRHGVVADKMNPIGKRLLGRKYLRKAQLAWSEDDAERAKKLVDWAIQFDPQNRAAIDLRTDIEAGRHDGDHSGGANPPQWPFTDPPSGDDAHDDMILDELEHGRDVEGLPAVTHDRGVPGSRQTLAQPTRSS